jgi:hypothetical protein
MNNRELGLIWMADILSRLYETWPQQIFIEPWPTISATGVTPEGPHNMVILWDDLWVWLYEEGVVRFDRGADRRLITRGGIPSAVLTAKGFEALHQPAPGTSRSFGDKLGEVAKEAEGSKTAAAELMGSFFGAFIRGVTF